MSAPAAITAQLVDMRNIGTHKVLRLTLHVPQEQALAAIAAFGWPTEAAPVPVAIARLAQVPDAPSSPASITGDARKLTQRLALVCKEPGFWQFLNDQHLGPLVVDDEDRAAIRVRQLLGVSSRADLAHNEDAALRARELLENYGAWLKAPEVVP